MYGLVGGKAVDHGVDGVLSRRPVELDERELLPRDVLLGDELVDGLGGFLLGPARHVHLLGGWHRGELAGCVETEAAVGAGDKVDLGVVGKNHGVGRCAFAVAAAAALVCETHRYQVDLPVGASATENSASLSAVVVL